jgi:Leucine-rich repeat (LRR) protein
LSLDLSRNNLTEVSSDLTDLHQLQTLRLDRNNLIDIPTGFNKLRLLRRLDLSFNDLSSSSSSSLLIALREVETMSLLQDLDLTGNSRLDPDLLGPKTRLLYDTVNISLSYFISLYQRVMATNKVVRKTGH